MEKVNFKENLTVDFDLSTERDLTFITLHVDGKIYDFDLEKENSVEKLTTTETIGSYFNPEYALDYDIVFEGIKKNIITCIDDDGVEFVIEVDDKLLKFINQRIEEKAVKIFIENMED